MFLCGGGAKFTHSYGRGLVVENSWFHHNFGYGLWLDIDDYDVTVRSNRIEANDRRALARRATPGALFRPDAPPTQNASTASY